MCIRDRWMTVPKAMRQTDDMLADATGDEAALLSEVKKFLCVRRERLETV